MNPEIWRYIFDAIDDPIFLHDPEFSVLLANRAYCREAGVGEAEALNKPYWEVFPRGSGPLPGCRDTLANRHAGNQEEVNVGEKLFLSTGYAVRDDQGKALYSLHILRNITESKRAERLLVEGEEKFRAIFEGANDGIVLIDDSGLIVNCNLEFERQTGRALEQLRQARIWEIRPDNKIDLARKKFEEIWQAGMGESTDLDFQKPDGEIVPIEFRSMAITIGGKLYLQSISRDITERRQAEEKNRRLNRMYRTISLCNQALVRAGDELELGRAMCQVLVEHGGFSAAWVGYAETGVGKRILPVAAVGIDLGEIEGMKLTWEDNEVGQGPMGCAIRSGEIVVSMDILTDPRWAHWNEPARRLGYVAAIAIPLRVNGTALGGLEIFAAEADAFAPDMIELLAELAGDLAFGIGNLRARAERMNILEKLELSLDHAVTAIAATVEMRDPYTAGHQRRVALLAAAIAKEMGLDENRVEGLRMAGVVHDIGKIHVPAEILSNPSKLTVAEFEIIKTHPQAGYDILKGIDFPWPVAEIVWQHHEKLDGSGYPRGLKGEEILLEARILTVADVVEAMASHRPYRPGFGVFPSLQEISRNKGKFYDERVAEACLRLFMERNYDL